MKPHGQTNVFGNEMPFPNTLPSLEERQRFASIFGLQFEEPLTQGAAQQSAYYEDYCRLYFASIFYVNQLRVIVDERNKLAQILEREESGQRDSEMSGRNDWSGESRKRRRRTADKIQRHYRCPVANCNRSYGSEGSLNQHKRLKHPELCGGDDKSRALARTRGGEPRV
eukprot:TRINITY_DN2552_c0_g2_i5.p2 TRINITY_DN2552_c0_g2~~TRINITY_DN2552_c0_g2_i5.p2  ORF type:complete len:169 (-),score=31.65 TRINITY_DN2552_c0_g2_i5:134-640(-)